MEAVRTIHLGGACAREELRVDGAAIPVIKRPGFADGNGQVDIWTETRLLFR